MRCLSTREATLMATFGPANRVRHVAWHGLCLHKQCLACATHFGFSHWCPGLCRYPIALATSPRVLSWMVLGSFNRSSLRSAPPPSVCTPGEPRYGKRMGCSAMHRNEALTPVAAAAAAAEAAAAPDAPAKHSLRFVHAARKRGNACKDERWVGTALKFQRR